MLLSCYTSIRVHTDHGKPAKSWNLTISFSRPGKSWNLSMGHGKSWKMTKHDFSEDNKALNTSNECVNSLLINKCQKKHAQSHTSGLTISYNLLP